MLVRVANREDADQTASSEAVWVCPVCLGLFGRQLVFKILEHLPYKQWKRHFNTIFTLNEPRHVIFPTMWHYNKCRLRGDCAASF